jgi:CheY-like chemotaxis protein
MFDRPSHAASDPRGPRGGVRREPASSADRSNASGKEPGAGAEQRPQARRKTRSLRCFLVEDSPVIRQNLISTLEEMLPLEVVASAEDEQEAVQWMRRADADCDLMIIDIFLKAGTGLEVLRKARMLKPQAKLVVLSNYATADMRQRCMDLGADRIFDKSAEVDELLEYGEKLAKARLN